MNLELFPELNDPPPKIIDGPDVVTRGKLQAFATFSVDGIYRYILGRIWNPDRALLSCGMLNPSKANELTLDPTVTRVVGFARRDHFGGVLIWNAYGLISTDPKALLSHPDPCGPRNVEAISYAIDNMLVSRTTVGWGIPPSRKLQRWLRATEVLVLSHLRGELWQFGPSTKDGFPRHPLYLRADTPIIKRQKELF